MEYQANDACDQVADAPLVCKVYGDSCTVDDSDKGQHCTDKCYNSDLVQTTVDDKRHHSTKQNPDNDSTSLYSGNTVPHAASVCKRLAYIRCKVVDPGSHFFSPQISKTSCTCDLRIEEVGNRRHHGHADRCIILLVHDAECLGKHINCTPQECDGYNCFRDDVRQHSEEPQHTCQKQDDPCDDRIADTCSRSF